MKKKILGILCGATLAIFSTSCSATVAETEVGIGQATAGMSTDKLIEIYGQPLQKNGEDWIFEHFTVEVDDDRPGVVEKVVTYSQNIGTPGDVVVGQDKSVLVSAYGNPDEVDEDRDETEYKYYNSNRTKEMEFKIVNNKITKISCKLK